MASRTEHQARLKQAKARKPYRFRLRLILNAYRRDDQSQASLWNDEAATRGFTDTIKTPEPIK